MMTRPNTVLKLAATRQLPDSITLVHTREYSASPTVNLSSPSFTTPKKGRKRKFIPRKAAVQITDQARNFFKALLESNSDKTGIILNYQQASSGQPRMVFTFGFVTNDELSPEDEGYVRFYCVSDVPYGSSLSSLTKTLDFPSVSLELLEDGTPKLPRDSIDDGLPKLYVHHNAFLKVLGATVDVDMENITPILYDKEGNTMDPNV